MVQHRATTNSAPPQKRYRRLRLAILGMLGVGLAFVGWNALSLSLAWRNVDRQTFDTEAFEALAPVLSPVIDDTSTELAAGTQEPVSMGDLSFDERYETYMVVGSDEGKALADVIILVLMPVDGSDPIMVSLPRDLYVANRCTQSRTRINANFAGCRGQVNGATLLAGAIQDFTGLSVDHFALFTMEGFADIIDAIGGMELCVDYQVRDPENRVPLDLPAGCSQAEGEQVLSWVRSRKTQELVDGRWRSMPGVSDFARNERQQELMLTLLSHAAAFRTPAEMTTFVTSLSDNFVLDDRLSLSAAIDLAWTHRNTNPQTIRRLKIPVRDYVTAGGAQVLIPEMSFAELIESAEL